MEIPQLDIEKGKVVVLYDGVCNLCNLTVQFIIKRDRKDKFRFAALQSEFGKRYSAFIPQSEGIPESVALIYGNQIALRSNAIIKICWAIGGIWQLMIIGKIIPRFFRDMIYNFIAQRRYRYFGRRASCLVPRKEYLAKFLN